MSQIGQASSLLNNCNLESTVSGKKLPQQQQPQPQQQLQQTLLTNNPLADSSKTSDEIIKAKLNAVSSVKTLGILFLFFFNPVFPPEANILIPGYPSSRIDQMWYTVFRAK
jgi:hypothetical protein